MALILPGGPSWAHYIDNITIGAAYLDSGVAVTAALGNTKGSTVTILPALAHDIEYLRLGIHRFAIDNHTTGSLATLLDIMIDPAGGTSWNSEPLIPNLLAGSSSAMAIESAGTAGAGYWYDFPIWVPAGASLGARAQTAYTVDLTGRVIVQGYGGNRNPASWWCGQHVTAIGPDTSASKGVMVTLATTPSFSSWADFSTPTTVDARAVQFASQGEADASYANTTNYLQFGISGTQIGPNLVRGLSSYEITGAIPTGPVFIDIPAGTQLQARGCRSYGSAGANDAAVYLGH